MPVDNLAVRRPQFSTWLTATNDLTSRFVSAARIPDLINFAGGLPALETFPTDALAALAKELTLQYPQDCLGYGPTDGLPELRDAIADRFTSPILCLSRENVLITTGGTQSLDLLGKVLIEPGEVIAAEFPTYVGAMDAWRPRQPQYREIVFDAGCSDLASAFAGAKLIYTVPNFSNPSGKFLDLPTREEIVAAAHVTGIWLVEDDPYGALQYDGPPLARLIDLSAHRSPGAIYDGPVVYMGSFSKELAPGLRVAWIIAAPEMIRALKAAKQGADLCSPGLNQRIGLAAMQHGLVDEMRPRLITLYRERRDALCAAMERHLSDMFVWDVPIGGMFVWATIDGSRIDTDRLLAAGMDEGVLVGPSSVFFPSDGNNAAIRLNFTFNPVERIEEGVRRLARAVRAVQRSSAESGEVR
ncbi:PLP-dependent aminotransferase family protein [Sphingomonas oligophenolica]|uniref:PLP-dependent aminotransferase family protein n=1 Tax=Sphingomonas oligophenolica TaxID=301154 RepID=A0ABU9Y6F1_9SPHN